jgi:hypothetical protein
MDRTDLLLALIVYFLALLTVFSVEEYPDDLLLWVGNVSAKLVIVVFLVIGFVRGGAYAKQFLEDFYNGDLV